MFQVFFFKYYKKAMADHKRRYRYYRGDYTHVLFYSESHRQNKRPIRQARQEGNLNLQAP